MRHSAGYKLWPKNKNKQQQKTFNSFLIIIINRLSSPSRKRMLNRKLYLVSCILVSCVLNVCLGGTINFKNMNTNDDYESDDTSFLSFEKFLEKTSLINHLRKSIESELNYLEQVISRSAEHNDSQKVLSKIRANYNLLDKDLDSFIPNQELLDQLLTY